MSRLLVVMGSGETTPGMLGVHREVFGALAGDPTCVMLDSPFAFQENRQELVERIGSYFAESLGHPVGAVRLAADADELATARALAQLAGADWVFAGPGSPSYALRCWQGSDVPTALAQVVAPGRSGALVLASAAAVTLGDLALPVYEIYKVGQDPHWVPGLGLMGQVLGWRCAVIPHYDNQEGGTHDTRYCYLGARRLTAIEPALGELFIVGVDEHTALVIDLDSGVARVGGRGSVTLRVAGRETTLPTGTTTTVAEIEHEVSELSSAAGADGDPGSGAGHQLASTRGQQQDAAPASSESAPLAGTTAESAELAAAVLTALPRSAASARAAVVALADRASGADRDRARVLAAAAVQALVEVREQERAASRWARSDELRDVLNGIGVELRDTPTGSTWRWL